MYVGYLTTDIIHYLRNAGSISFKRGKSKNSMFNFNGIVTWHREVITLHPAWPFHVRTTEIELNSDAVMTPKKTDNAKKRTADVRAKRVWVYRFWASGRPIMCMEILLYSAILFTAKFTDHVIAAKCPYNEIPGIF